MEYLYRRYACRYAVVSHGNPLCVNGLLVFIVPELILMEQIQLCAVIWLYFIKQLNNKINQYACRLRNSGDGSTFKEQKLQLVEIYIPSVTLVTELD